MIVTDQSLPFATAAPAFDPRALLHSLSRDARPLLHDGASTWTGVTLAAMAERWRRELGALGVVPGDRIALALPSGAAFVGALLGGLAHRATVALAPPDDDVATLLASLDARAMVRLGQPSAGVIGVGSDGTPRFPHSGLRERRGALAASASMLLRTSGSGGDPRWVALSAWNVGAVLRSHAHALPTGGSVVASVLPWHHAFGLVLELLPSLASGALLVRDPQGGRDGAALVRLARAHGATHLSAVPATLARVVATAGGPSMLAALRGGIVGGASVEAPLAAALQGTRLRVGYGLTEASPGVALGEPGTWHARALGRVVGCEARIDADGVLAFRGDNAALGDWRDGALVTHEPRSWRRTGDVVHERDGMLWFEGRASATFKLANGRWVQAWRVESALRDRMPALGDVMLASDDGERLILLHTAGDALDDAMVRDALGPLAALPLDRRAVSYAQWPRTRKGDVDRRAALALLRSGV